MNLKLRKGCKRILVTLCVTMLASICMFASGCAVVGPEPEKVLPSIEGPITQTVYEGYNSFLTEKFTIAGTGVTVTADISQDAKNKIKWDGDNCCFSVTKGLTAGQYTASVTVTNGNTEEDAIAQYTLIVEELPKIVGDTEIELLGSDYEQVVKTYTVSGNNVTVSKKSGDDLIVWNDAEKTLTVNEGLSPDVYTVVLVATNGNEAYDSTFTVKVLVKRLYTLTGSYAYGSGKYDKTNDKYTNEGDTVSAKIGTTEAILDTVNQTYTFEGLAEGTYDISVSSEYFFGATVSATVSGDNDSVEVNNVAVLKNPKVATTSSAWYTGNQVGINGNSETLFAGNPTAAAGEGFVVKYTVNNNGSTGWFNRGGLHVETNATERNKHDFGLVKAGAQWRYFVKQSGVTDRFNSNPLVPFDQSDVWDTTIVFLDGVYYFYISYPDGDKSYCAGILAETLSYVKGSEIVDNTVTHALGLSSYCDSNYATAFKDITYAIGTDAAKDALAQLPTPVFNASVGGGKSVSLPNATAKEGEGFVINFSVADNKNTAWYMRGGLQITGTSTYRFGFANPAGLYAAFGSTADYFSGLKAAATGQWNITIAYYQGEYYFSYDNNDGIVNSFMLTSASSGFQYLSADNKTAMFSNEANRTLGLHSNTDNSVATTFSNVTYEIGDTAAKKFIDGLQYPRFDTKVSGGSVVTITNAVAKDGAGFVIKYTVADSSDTAWFMRGGLQIDAGNGVKYRFGFSNPKGLYAAFGSNADYFNVLKAATTGKWNVTIVFYNGEYYFSYDNDGGEVETFKLNSASSGFQYLSADNKTALFSTTATRTLCLHANNSNNVATTFSNVTYAIGNTAAQAAIAAMNLEQ